MNKLEEIINQGRSLLFDIYEIRNEVVKTHAFQSPTSQHDAGTLINAHDQMLSALDELESLSGIALEDEYEVPDFGDSDHEEDASVRDSSGSPLGCHGQGRVVFHQPCRAGRGLADDHHQLPQGGVKLASFDLGEDRAGCWAG